MENFVTVYRNAMRAMLIGIIVILVGLSAYTRGDADGAMYWKHEYTPPHVPSQCWTGQAPADMQGRIPGHVYAMLPGGYTGVYGKPWVGRALQQTFGGKPTYGLTVIGFCR
jgi:hypothetical protein